MNLILADALPNASTGYVFAAYAVVFLLLLIYLWILGAKYQRLSRELTRINQELESAGDAESGSAGPPQP